MPPTRPEIRQQQPIRMFCCALSLFVMSAPAADLWAQQVVTKPQPLSAESQQLGKSLFSALKTSRERLRSGICRIRETTWLTRRTGETVNLAADIFSAFDYDKGLLRYDQEGARPAETTRFFRTPEQSALYSAETEHLVVLAPSAQVSSKYALKPIDARAVGLASLNELRSGWTFERLFELYTRQLQLVDVREEVNGRFQIILSHPPTDAVQIQRHIQLDSRKDYVPVRYHYRYFNKDTDDWSEPLAVVETTWSKQADVWLPDSIHAIKGTGESTVTDLSFTWDSVNEGVSASLFEQDSLEAKVGTKVVDVRHGDANPVTLGTTGEMSNAGPNELETDSDSRLTSLLLISAIIIALVFAVWLWYRAKQRRKGPITGQSQ